MQIFRDLKDIQLKEDTVVALGNFDGVHLGHRELIRRAVTQAEKTGLAPAVFTFSNHPRNLLAGEDVVKNILYPEEKAALMEEMGVRYLFDIPFTMEICTMEPLRYLEELLLETFRAKELYCGFNYRFGYKAGGDEELLREEGAKRGCRVHVVEPIQVDGEVVSSTRIRERIGEGDMASCEKLLGRPYTLNGTVVHGNQLGRTIGFPTCNILVDETMATPPNGVYITTCLLEGVRYPAITNIGVKPTVGTYEKSIETHLFDFEKDVYGKAISVEFHTMVRTEKKFDGIEDLTAEIARNCETAREYHGIA